MSGDTERISKLFRNIDLNSSSERRSSDSGSKGFQLTPNLIYPIPHTGVGGATTSLSVSPRDKSSSSCLLHVHHVPSSGSERRGSTGGIRKGHTPSPPPTTTSSYHNQHHHLSSSWDHHRDGDGRRGSGDGLLFPKKENRKFSQDSIDFNEPKTWESKNGPIIEEENESSGGSSGVVNPKFLAVTTIEDIQAIRCAEFHPRGHVYAVGSNSKTLRICSVPDTHNLSKTHTTTQPNIILKKQKHHRGSIYCLGWSPDGNLLATGSNDKTIKLTKFDETRKEFTHSEEIELTMHDGTIRDICFIEDLSNKSSLLVSGGAGDCKIYVTDCLTSTPFQAFSGHSGPILSLYNWGGVIFASGSQDKSIRLWDLRARDCVNVISPLTGINSTTIKSAVGSVCVDPTGRLLISGHEDGAIVLFDIRGNRQIQSFKPHGSDVKSVRFSPNAYYLLSAGYDHRLMLTDLQGDLSLNLNSIVVGIHGDRVISGRWHPTEFSFLSTSADKRATLWALPPSP